MPRNRNFRDEIGNLVKEISIPTVAEVQDIKSIHPLGLSHVSSYDWLDTRPATIAVPGMQF